MTTTEDIRAEAVRKYSNPKSRATESGRHASANQIAGFMDGAKWVASLPVTDEQVEVAVSAFMKSLASTPDGATYVHRNVRAALEAVRVV